MNSYLHRRDHIFPGHPSMRCCFRWIPPLSGPMSVPAPIMWPQVPHQNILFLQSQNNSHPQTVMQVPNLFFLVLVREKLLDFPADTYGFFLFLFFFFFFFTMHQLIQGPRVIKLFSLCTGTCANGKWWKKSIKVNFFIAEFHKHIIYYRGFFFFFCSPKNSITVSARLWVHTVFLALPACVLTRNLSVKDQ